MVAHRFTPQHSRLLIPLLVAACLPGLAGASHRTANFVVSAPTADAARQVAERAETCRVEIANLWLGHELPAWTTPCPIRVKLTKGEAGGLTSFGFQRGKVSDQEMTVEGRLDRILASSLPHEVTHTIFAAYFGGPMPRWADEGASLLSEDLREFHRHDQIVEDLFARRGNFPLDRLFNAEEYPSDLMGFYGQGYSMSRFLVETGGRPRFLQFVRDGSRSGWTNAARTHYGQTSLNELDRSWRSWHTYQKETLAHRASSHRTQAVTATASNVRPRTGSDAYDVQLPTPTSLIAR